MKIIHFIITNQVGDKKYITSLYFKELFLLSDGVYMVPKSLCVISKRPIFSLQKQLLTLLFQKVVLPSNSVSLQTLQQASVMHPRQNLVALSQQSSIERAKESGEQFARQRLEFYLSVFFNHLYHNESIDSNIEIEGKRPSKSLSVETYFRYRNTRSYGFILENYSFELLLQSLKPDKIIFLLTALLLERKILLIKEKFGDIAVIMESLVELLCPLKWNFVFITYLTPKLVECLDAPFPYMIGVSRKVWEDHCVMREFPDDIIVFDIDNQEKLNWIREELPPLPQPQANILERGLRDLLDMRERYTEELIHKR